MDLRERLRRGPPIVLDGPTGTELERRGCDTASPLWSTLAVRTEPDIVAAVHRDHVRAGADLLTAVTFRADRLAFRRAGLDEAAWRTAVADAVRLARNASQGRAWVAGSMAPLGDCYAPDEVPDEAVLEREHGAQARLLADVGVDAVLVETMNTVREAVAAARAVRRTGPPVLVSFVVKRGTRLLSGEALADACRMVRAAGADAVLVNCSSLPACQDAAPVLAAQGIPWGVYPNGSLADPQVGWTAGMEVDDADVAEAAARWLRAGARLVGSCCGTTPATTARLRALIDAGARSA